MIKVGIIGGAGYTAGELIRILLHHPNAGIEFVQSTSNARNPISDVHIDLLGESELTFTDQMPFEQVDVNFLCMGHGKSVEFIEKNNFPKYLKIIDLSHDFRLKRDGNDFIYGLPELNREEIESSERIANPGCFATGIQLALLPLAEAGLLKDEIHGQAITGSTGAGQKPTATSHFSWRNSNVSAYKIFEHQHEGEILQSLKQLQNVTALMRQRMYQIERSNTHLKQWYDRASVEGFLTNTEQPLRNNTIIIWYFFSINIFYG